MRMIAFPTNFAIRLAASAMFLLLSRDVFAGPINPISPERAANLPGLEALFHISNASETPRILEGEDYVAGEVVARFLLEVTDEEIAEISLEVGATSWERKSPLGLFILRGPARDGDELEEMMARLWDTDTTVDISPNYTGALPLFVPNDPHHVDQWYQSALSDIDLDLPEAWDITMGSTNVVVAVLDSGLRDSHPEFTNRIFVNPGETLNGIDDDSNGYVDDVSGWDVFGPDNNPSDPTNGTGLGHGTWVTSVLLANSDNAHQVAGFDFNAKVLPLRCFDNTHFQYGEIAAAMDYIVANPQFAQIVNMSFTGLSPLNVLTSQGLTAMAQSAILITGSGNDYQNSGGVDGNADLYNPAAHPDVITVSGTDDSDARADFSDSGTSVQFAAPADDIYVASFLDPTNSNAADVRDGTSFSAPMVAGIASLCLALDPSMTKEDLIAILRTSAVDLGPPGRDIVFGWGRVNAYGAVQVIFVDGFETGDTSRWDLSLP